MSERIIFDCKSSPSVPQELKRRTAKITVAEFFNEPGIVARVIVDDGSGQGKPIHLENMVRVTNLKWALACITLKEMKDQPVTGYYRDGELVGLSYPC